MPYICWKDGKTKSLTVTYDDGVSTDKKLINELNAAGIRGTFNLNSRVMFDDCDHYWNMYDGDERIYILYPNEAAALYEGHEIACHGLDHKFLTTLTTPEIIKEIENDKINLEKLTSYPIRSFAYPCGDTDERVDNLLKLYGFSNGRAPVDAVDRHFWFPKNNFNWCPTAHHSDKDLMKKLDKFFNENFNTLSFFSLFGHSYELPSQGWNLIHDFCEKAGHNNDTWYCTVGEAFDYMNATRQIYYSADGKTAYNPTATDIWFIYGESNEKNRERRVLKAGKSLKLD